MDRCFRQRWGARTYFAAVTHRPRKRTIGFAGPHGLTAGQGGEQWRGDRFVGAIVDASTVQLNAPSRYRLFAGRRWAGVDIRPRPRNCQRRDFRLLESGYGAQRLCNGGAVDQMEIDINGDFHEFVFSGQAQDVADSKHSGSSGGAGQCRASGRAGARWV